MKKTIQTKQTNELSNPQNILDFITQADKAERMIKLKNDVMSKLAQIRRLKSDLQDATDDLKILLQTEIEEDKDLSELLKGVL